MVMLGIFVLGFSVLLECVSSVVWRSSSVDDVGGEGGGLGDLGGGGKRNLNFPLLTVAITTSCLICSFLSTLLPLPNVIHKGTDAISL